MVEAFSEFTLCFYVSEHLVHAFMTRCLDYCNALIVFSVGCFCCSVQYFVKLLFGYSWFKTILSWFNVHNKLPGEREDSKRFSLQ